MPQNNGLCNVKRACKAGIFQRFAFFNARRQAGYQRGIRTQSLGGQLKAGAGARGRLVEKQCNAALGQNTIAGQRVLNLKSRGAGKNTAYALSKLSRMQRGAIRDGKGTAKQEPMADEAGGVLMLR